MTKDTRDERSVGLTKDAGWEIGVRRTLPLSTDALWDRLTSAAGLALWLAPGAQLPADVGRKWNGSDGSSGELRSLDRGSLIRLTWQPKTWSEPSRLQIRLAGAATGTTVSVHHERLASAEQREQMRAHWSDVIDQLKTEG